MREYEDGCLAVFHNQLTLGRYDPDGRLEEVPTGPGRPRRGGSRRSGTRKADRLRATKTGHVHLLLTRPINPLDKHESVQGSQFTSEAFADRVLAAGVTFSMDGRGRFLDNIFIERLWRSLKYEAVYLYELRDGLDAERIIGSWIDFYNEVRPHSSLRGRTPGEAYREAAEVW